MKILLRAVAIMWSIGISCFGAAAMWMLTTMDAAQIFAVMCVTAMVSLLISLIIVNSWEERYDGEKK